MARKRASPKDGTAAPAAGAADAAAGGMFAGPAAGAESTQAPPPTAAGASARKPSAADRGSYTVLARRYRPQQFADLVGQEHVAEALTRALESGRVAHAYLFTGARGVGKTSTARILAKALNCVRGPTPYPCDACDSCRAIAAGEDIDVLEIDGASNRGIEDARELRHSVAFRPTRSRYKIYIIDEVHMLTREAFNALLKTLEEPPPHVKFIFATTEVQKIPITILSRCQRFDFAHVRPAAIAEQLRKIVQQEQRQADEAALQWIARKAGGSMRDAQSLLDLLLAADNAPLTLDRVAQLLGTAAEGQVAELADLILRQDTAAALDFLHDWFHRGVQVGEILDQLIYYWRSLMLCKCGGAALQELPVEPQLLETVRRQASQMNLDAILAGLDVWTNLKARWRDALQGQVLLEMAVVRLCRMGELLSVGELLAQLASGRLPELSGTATTTPTSGRPASASAHAAPATTRPASATTAATTPQASKKNAPLTEPAAGEPPAADPAASSQPVPLRPDTLPAVWERCLQKVSEKFPLLAQHLHRADVPAISGPNQLVIRFPAAYNWAYEACQKHPQLVAQVEESLQTITGQQVRVNFQLLPRPAAPAVEVVKSAPATPAPAWRDWPLFRKAAETLGAQVVHLDTGFQPLEAASQDGDEPSNADPPYSQPDDPDEV